MWRRIRAALAMGLVWALAWGAVGGVMELIANFYPRLNAVDMWIQALAIPGFLCGAVFSVILGIVAARRKFSELSVSRFAVWGAVGGAALGVLLTGAIGFPVVNIVPLVLMSAASAGGTLAVARVGKEPESLDAGTERDRHIKA